MSIIEFDDIINELKNIKNNMLKLEIELNLNETKHQIQQLEKEMVLSSFWDNRSRAEAIIVKLNQYKMKISKYENLFDKIKELEDLIVLCVEENDLSFIDEVKKMFKSIKNDQKLQFASAFLSGEYDSKNAVLMIHAGAGGTDSCDWVSMLLKMYMRYADKHEYTYDILDYVRGDKVGYKSITIEIYGKNAYGYLKAEKGIHRLVRISPFNAGGKRHTSFASVDVMPDLDIDVDIDILNDDLKIDTYRSSGAGGQHINKTESAVRITHIPTGVVVQCQNERSQYMNKNKAMQLLKSKLLIMKEIEHAENLSDIRGKVQEINFAYQIRSYVLHPYSMVKDHRTNVECTNVNKVLDGDLDMFIIEFLIRHVNV